jgi:DNA-binding SARP family transcriptional activator
LEYFLFGPMRVRAGGVDLALGGPKQRAVLAMLLLAGGSVVRFDRLVDGLWGQRPPEKALASLRAYVANLRRLMQPGGPEVAHRRLTTRSVGYQLDLGGDTVDIHRFEELVVAGRRALISGDAAAAAERLTRAGQLWRGDPLAEFTGWSFADPEIDRLTGLRRSAIEAGFDAALLLGRHADLVPEIEAAIVAAPVHERLWAQLMFALSRSGRRAEALQAYDRVRAVLDRELGIAPSDELRRLFHSLCRDGTDPPTTVGTAPRPPLALALTAAEPATPTTPVPEPDDGEQQPVVGRTAELAWLAKMVGAARRGRGGLAVFAGESGIGKTTLAAAVTEQARRAGLVVAWASHPDGVRKPLLWAWIQLLRELGEQLGEAVRAAVCDAAPEVVTLVPEWPEWGARPVVRELADPRFEVIDGVVRAIREVTTARPVVLVLDDVHRADQPTRDVLALLADRLHRLPALIVATWAIGSAGSATDPSEYGRLVGRSDISALELAGLDDDAVGVLVEQLSGVRPGAAFVRAMQSRSGGNPFFIREIVRLLCARGRFDGQNSALDTDVVPDAVAGVIRGRMAGLDPSTRTVLGAAAVIGAEFEPIAVADVLGLPASVVRERLDEARRAAILDEATGRPGWFTFNHGLTRDAVVAQIESTERAKLHALVATSRMRDAARRSYEWMIATADHAWRAGSELAETTALAITDAALTAAAARSAYADVVVLSEHALQICGRLPREPERFEREAALWLRLALAWSIRKGQNHDDVRMAFQRAFELGDQHNGGQLNGVVLHCIMICTQGRYHEAAVIADGLIERYAETGDPVAGMGHYVRAMIDCVRGDLDASLAAIESVLADPPVPDDALVPRCDVRVHAVAACIFGLRGEKERAWRVAQAGIDLGLASGDTYSTAMVKLSVVQANAIQGIVPGTAQLADELAAELSELGMEQLAASARIMRDWARALGPDRADTAAEAYEAYEIYTDGGTRMLAPLYLALLADIESERGNRDAARELVHRAELLATATGERVWDGLLSDRLRRLRAGSATPRRVGRTDLGA